VLTDPVPKGRAGNPQALLADPDGGDLALPDHLVDAGCRDRDQGSDLGDRQEPILGRLGLGPAAHLG
jgi:hypothetical protein